MRAFVAVPCPNEVKDRLAVVQKEIKDFGGLSLVGRENMHLTLKFLGEISDEKVAEVSEALDSLELKSYPVTVKGLGVFPKLDYVRVIWAGVEDGGRTVELAGRVDELLKPFGFPKEKDFHSHVTLARVKFLKDREAVKRLIDAKRSEVFGSYAVERILLMKSVLSPKGPTYSMIKEVRLA